MAERRHSGPPCCHIARLPSKSSMATTRWSGKVKTSPAVMAWTRVGDALPGFALGASLAYLLDGRQGRRRRAWRGIGSSAGGTSAVARVSHSSLGKTQVDDVPPQAPAARVGTLENLDAKEAGWHTARGSPASRTR
jgi:hypothetical protein